MKNYTFGWKLKAHGYIEIPESDYTERQKKDKEFIDKLSEVVQMANCGWDGVVYKVMRYTDDGSIEKYMVLYIGAQIEVDGGRWIPISGNSKGCNITVLGENLW